MRTLLIWNSGSFQLKEAINAELKAANLQSIPHTMTKVIQLYETKNSRHSTMIVGSTLSGKTVSWRILQAAMGRLNKDGDPNYQAVRVRSSAFSHFIPFGSPTLECDNYTYHIAGISTESQSPLTGWAVWWIRPEHEWMDRWSLVQCHATNLRWSVIVPSSSMWCIVCIHMFVHLPQTRSQMRSGWYLTALLTPCGLRAWTLWWTTTKFWPSSTERELPCQNRFALSQCLKIFVHNIILTMNSPLAPLFTGVPAVWSGGSGSRISCNCISLWYGVLWLFWSGLAAICQFMAGIQRRQGNLHFSWMMHSFG